MAPWQPKIIAFLCNWCTYGAADLAGVSRLTYPPNIRIVRLPCTGRISVDFILAALRDGADGVWVSGCHPGDCHYIEGNYYARRRFTLLRELFIFMGVDPNRIHFSWISSAEATKFAEMATKVTETIQELGPNTYFRTHVA